MQREGSRKNEKKENAAISGLNNKKIRSTSAVNALALLENCEYRSNGAKATACDARPRLHWRSLAEANKVRACAGYYSSGTFSTSHRSLLPAHTHRASKRKKEEKKE